jgi:hypothetical protein
MERLANVSTDEQYNSTVFTWMHRLPLAWWRIMQSFAGWKLRHYWRCF